MSSADKNLVFARHFFGRLLPRHIVDNVEKFAALQGCLAFYVRDQGKWSVRLGNLETPIEDGMAPDAELSLWFSAAAFEGFIKGTLNIAKALAQQDVAFEGDPTLLERFGFLLTASTSALGTRLGR